MQSIPLINRHLTAMGKRLQCPHRHTEVLRGRAAAAVGVAEAGGVER